MEVTEKIRAGKKYQNITYKRIKAERFTNLHLNCPPVVSLIHYSLAVVAWLYMFMPRFRNPITILIQSRCLPSRTIKAPIYLISVVLSWNAQQALASSPQYDKHYLKLPGMLMKLTCGQCLLCGKHLDNGLLSIVPRRLQFPQDWLTLCSHYSDLLV